MPLGAGSSPMTFSAAKLTYPIFNAEFDPYNRGYLIVCGGGGENRTGVPNKLTLLDVSSRSEIKEVTDIDLSVEEDSPQSIASLATKQGLISLVGISSSEKDQKAGKNEHLRSFNVEFPTRAKASGSDEKSEAQKGARIQLAGQSTLFNPPTGKNSRVYQRVARLSPVTNRESASKRIGAITTADAAENEIVLFDATTFIPKTTSVLQRLPLQKEAEDLDLFEYEEGTFALAYCTDTVVSLYRLKCDFATKTSTPDSVTPKVIYSLPRKVDGPIPKIRSLRWISPYHILLLVNNQPKGVPELQVLHVPPPDTGPSKIVHWYPLPKKMSIGVRLAVCRLDADPGTGQRQIIAAVAGQDLSIQVLTLDILPASPTPSGAAKDTPITQFSKFARIDTSSQHDQGISALAFSNFFPPRQPADSPKSVASETQYVKLASTSLGYTVSVETIALTSTPTSPAKTSKDVVATSTANPTNHPSVRWVLSSRPIEFLTKGFGIFVAAFGILVIALLIQNYRIATSNVGSNVAPVESLVNLGSNPTLSLLASDATSALMENKDTAAAAISSAADTLPGSGKPKVAHRIADMLHLHRHVLSSASSLASSATSTLSSASSSIASVATDDLSQRPQDAAQAALHLIAPANPYAPASELTAAISHNAAELREKGAKKYDELTRDEQKLWRKRLVDAGRWTEEEGLTILKSILFSEYAGVVGGALRDAVLN